MPREILQRIRKVGESATRAAGQLAWQAFKTQGFRIDDKGSDGDLVTEIDLAAEKVIVSEIQKAFPTHGLQSEECGLIGSPDAEFFWMIDPLDGTNNFAVGIPLFGVGVSVFYQGILTTSFIYHSPLDQLFVAERGGGAFLNDLKLPKLGPRNPKAPLTLAWGQGYKVESPSLAIKLQFDLQVGSKRLLRFWAPTLTWALAAQGKIDGIVIYDNEAEDLHPGILLLEEVGGVLRDFSGGNLQKGWNRMSVVGAHPQAAAQVMNLVQGSIGS